MMRELRRSAIVGRPAAVMFALVNDIESYPQFVPDCAAAEILERSPDEIVARLTVRRGPLQTQFTTRNRLKFPEAVEMTLVEGPFRAFQGHWRFRPLSESGCEIELLLRYQYSNRLKGMLLEPLLAETADQLVKAFVERAQRHDVPR
jgi:ribosome-associated toxin RatA of RatAB toxin-antitoxin module